MNLQDFLAELVTHLDDYWSNEELGYWLRRHRQEVRLIAASPVSPAEGGEAGRRG